MPTLIHMYTQPVWIASPSTFTRLFQSCNSQTTMCFYDTETLKCIHCTSILMVFKDKRTELGCTASESGSCREEIFLTALTSFTCCGCVHEDGEEPTSPICRGEEDEEQA
jgi:hypothetical protein